MLKNKGISKTSFLKSCNQIFFKLFFLVFLSEVIGFVLNSITLIVLTSSLGMFKVILPGLGWEEFQNADLCIPI